VDALNLGKSTPFVSPAQPKGVEVMEYRPRNLLITGGAGFIGCNFVRYLLKTDQQVHVFNLDLLTYAGSLENLKKLPDPGRHHFVQGDICDRDLVTRLLREREIDTIVHFAAESHVDRSISGPAAFVQTNVVGTFTLLEAARERWRGQADGGNGRCRFHHISTDEVYGTLRKADPAFTETTPYAPNSPYSAAKAGSDHLVRAYFHTYGLPVVTTNCSNNYGPYQHAEKFIPTVIRSCLRQQPIPVYGDGSNIRDWLYVEDHCRGIDAVLRRGAPGETYNIGGCNEWANIDIVKKICAVMDERRPRQAPHDRFITFVTDRPGHDWRYAIDATKISAVLRWEPAETFETGIVKTVDWYLDREAGG
jgi:dTDP-glucose 4,6-dehydratase